MKKTVSLLFLLFISAGIYSQGVITPLQYWQSISGSQNAIYKSKIVIDNINNIYIAGATMNGATSDILLVKYNSSGVQQWIQQYNGGGNGEDVATGLCVDTLGNVYITGYETGTVLNPTNVDLITIKYNSSGTQEWLTTYDGGFNAYDAGADITVDNTGNVYVTGKSYNASANSDIVTIKYDPIGTQQWVTRYDHTTHLNDEGIKISARNGAIVVSGIVQINSTDYKYAVFTCEDVTGVQVASIINSTSSSGADQLNDMVQDSLGNIYIAGAIPVAGHGYDYSILKLNPTLNVIWQSTYNGTNNLDDVAKGIRVSVSGNVFVTGYTTSTTGGKNFATLKYNSSGTQQWIQTYNDTLNADDESNALVLDNSGNVYVTGYTTTALNHADYYTIKYNNSGTLQWSMNTDGDAHLDDKATGIAIDKTGRIAITGQSALTTTTYQYITGKYIEKDVITPPDYNNESAASNFLFYKNSGQLINTSNQAIPDVKFYTNNTSPKYYINNNSYSFVFAHIDTIASTQDTIQRIDLTFDGINATNVFKTYPLEEKAQYLNYFLPQCPNGITEVHGNQRLITPELYSNIDLEYSSNQNGAKYYFIVKPGGDATNIQLNYIGASSTNIDGNTHALTINSLIGSITYDRPMVYQLSATNTIIPITNWTADWQTNGVVNDKYKFNIGAYDHTKALIIEMDQGNITNSSASIGNLEWSTFYGGTQGEELDDITIDAIGNSYTTGVSHSIDFPTTSGVLQNTLNLGTDVVVVKFDGTTLDNTWATYYGGTNDDRGYGISVDANQNVYVAGYTASDDFPILNPIQAFGYGASDGFVIKLNSTGTAKIFATTYGGGGMDWFNDIALDHLGNLYAVGRTFSSVPSFPQSGTTPYSNAGFGIILKLTTNGTEEWATAFGGTYNCNITGVEVDLSNNVFLTGETRNLGFVQINPNFVHPFGGTGSDVDAFITKLNVANNIVWSSFYGGNGVETSDGIAINSNGDVAIVGGTLSTSGFPLKNPPTGGNSYGGDAGNIPPEKFCGDGFIAVFSNDGHHLFGTYYGGSSNDEIFGVCYDAGNRLYISGFTASVNNSFLIPTPNASGAYVSSTITGSTDAFVSCFNTNYHQIWGTYFGGAEYSNLGETCYGISAFQNSKLYLAGITTSLGVPTPNHFPIVNFGGTSYFQNALNTNNYSSGASDGFVSRFDLAPVVISAIDDVKPDGSGISVFPNPSNSVFNLSIDLTATQNSITINVYNMLGEKIHSETIKNAQSSIQRIINLSSFNSGMYVVQVQMADGIYCKKIIKTNN